MGRLNEILNKPLQKTIKLSRQSKMTAYRNGLRFYFRAPTPEQPAREAVLGDDTSRASTKLTAAKISLLECVKSAALKPRAGARLS